MLDLTHEQWAVEIDQAEKFRNEHLNGWEDQLRRYVGPFYASSNKADWFPENHYHEFLALGASQLIYNNPRVRCSSRRPAVQSGVAQGMGYGLNRWCRDNNFRKTLTQTYPNTMFRWGILMTVQANTGLEGEDAPFWPQVYDITPDRFIIDPLCQSFASSRYRGHLYIVDKDDLIARAEANPDEGWDIEAIRSCPTRTGEEKVDPGGQYSKYSTYRKELFIYSIYVPELQLEGEPGPEDNFHGTILDIGVGKTGDGQKKCRYLRKTAYYGPRWGPYAQCGIYYVPRKPFALGPITANEAQIRDLNAHVLAATNGARNRKQLVFVDSADPKLGQQIRDAPDQFVIPVAGLEHAKTLAAEIGGVSQQQINYIAILRERLDRNSGINDAQRGNITGDASATEVAIATDAARGRWAFIKQQWEDGIVQALKTVAWYLYYDERVLFPMGQENAQQMGMQDPMFRGGETVQGPEGRYKPDKGASFDDLELEIEPYSMERTNEVLAQRKTQELIAVLGQIAPFPQVAPWINMKPLLQMIGDSMNIPGLDSILDEQKGAMAGQISQMQQLNEATPEAPEQQAPTPSMFDRISQSSAAGRAPTGDGGPSNVFRGGGTAKSNGSTKSAAV